MKQSRGEEKRAEADQISPKSFRKKKLAKHIQIPQGPNQDIYVR